MSGQDDSEDATLFELVDIHGRLTMDQVYENGLHALKRLHISNLTNKQIVVRMRSNLRNQLIFQTDNENLIEWDVGDETTNTVAWSQTYLQKQSQQLIITRQPCNELFNQVNHIDELTLLPHETKPLIIGFLPEARDDDDDNSTTGGGGGAVASGSSSSSGNNNNNNNSGVYLQQSETDTFGWYNVTGSIFFFGYYDISCSVPDYQLAIKFRANVCQSILWTDVAETGINFDDCIMGETYSHDFILKNKSDIDLYWKLNTVDLPEGWLHFMNVDTTELIDHGPIEGGSHMRIRITFTPKEVGEFSYDLQLENLNDARNVIQIKIHAIVRSVAHKESLVISSGNIIDFGDCISGQWKVQQMVLNNISENTLEIRFIPEGVSDVVFDIKSSLDTSDDSDHHQQQQQQQILPQRNLLLTPITTIASVSELSATDSDFSRSSSPISMESSSVWGTGARIYTPSAATMSVRSTTDSEVKTQSSSHPVENYTRIEDLLLKPGKERIIQISYRPKKDASLNDFNAGQLIRRNFRIVLEYGTYRSTEPKERKSIQCRARTCTSFVEVIPKEINFGDTDVGTLKSIPINIFNRSDIMARVELEFTSKVLNCLRGEITIQPRGYVELKLDLYPRKVNPEYRKQITLVNYLNNDNDQIIEVQSTNIDKNRVTFHSLFYRILTATGANYLDFGSIALNSPSLRTFTVENIRNKPLTLDITTSAPDDIAIYVKKKRALTRVLTSSPSTTHTTHHHHHHTVKKKDHRIHLQRLLLDNNSSNNTPDKLQQKRAVRADRAAFSTTAYLDLATTPAIKNGKRRLLRSINKRELWDLRDMTSLAMENEKNIKRNVNINNNNNNSTVNTNINNKINNSNNSSIINSKNKNISSNGNESGNPNNKNNRSNESDDKKLNATTKHNNNSNGINSNNNDIKDKNIVSNMLNDRSSKKKKFSTSHRSMGITAARYKSRKNLNWSDITGKTRVPFEDLLSVLEHESKASTPLFPKQSAEEQFVRHQLAWRHEMNRLIEKGDLVQTSTVHVDPEGEEEVVIVYTPNGTNKPYIQSAPKKQDARIFLRLVDFDRDIEQTEFENLLDLNQNDIPLREVIVRAQLCRSVMDLGQKNINFGIVERNERHAKSILLHNRSETPLLYAIRKSGSIASGDIDLGAGRYGVVRAFGKREIEFTFEPTLPGPFMERLIVENIRDSNNDQVLSLKAMVRKPSTFYIQSLELAFGPCLLDQACSHSETIVVTNTNKQSRMFEVRVDPNEAIFGCYFGEFDFIVEDDESKKTLTKEAEEEIENLEQKLKIAKRKNQPDKIKKYLKKLEKLKETNVEKDQDSTTSTSATLKDPSAMIYKKTSESVVFPLDPHATKTITVHLKAVMRPLKQGESFQDTDMPPLQVKGRILVHEYKNTDVCKSVMYTALICKNQADYSRALSLDGDSGNTPSSSPPPPPSTITTATDTTINTIADATITDESAHISINTKQPTESLKLERTNFDAERAEINQRSTFYVRVTNESDKQLPYSFVVDEDEKDFFICPTATTSLDPNETRKITFEILPTTVGKQQHTLALRNDDTGVLQHFTLHCLVHRNQYLSFPSLSEDSHSELDLGFSYVDPGNKFSQVTPLLIKNITDEDIFISCQSNLSHQVLIFMDEFGERGLVDMMPFKSGNLMTVWVAVQPNLLTGYLGNTVDDCRTLVGGIKFSIFNKNEDEENNINLLWTQTVKFTTVIGESHLQVSHKIINLGYTDLLNEEFYGAFTIQNKSGKLPLDYEVECTSGNIVLDRRGGTLKGWKGISSTISTEETGEDDEDYIDTLATSLAQITFRICSYRFGLLNERLLVTNKHNSNEVFEIEVRLFVDCGKMDLLSVPSKQIALDTNVYHSNHREAYPLRIIKWESIYVYPEDSDSNHVGEPKLTMMQLPPEDENRLYQREIEVANTSGQPMLLFAASDVDVKVTWMTQDQNKIIETSMLEQSVVKPFYQCSINQLSLQPGQRVRVKIHCPSIEKISEDGLCLAVNGRSGLLKGMLILYDERQQVDVIAVELEALFCVSQSNLSVDRIDLGQIGHVNSWKPTKFQFSVYNVADVPMIYTIQAPLFFDFVPLDKNGTQLTKDKRFYVPARKTQMVEGILDPGRIDDRNSGIRRYDIHIINQRNPCNVMALRLKAVMTRFELCFDRLVDGELLLPSLQHPIPNPNVTCDNWFAIRNTTEDDIRFEIGADISPDLKDYVKLDVLSRYSNSPLKGGITVSAQGKMEVRIRASPNESTRLPRDRPDLTDTSTGIIMAQLWVTTNPKDEDQTVREVIPVRIFLVDTPTFSLSERRLDFKLVTYYRDQQQRQQQQFDSNYITSTDNDLLQHNIIEDDLLSLQSTPAVCVPESYPLTIINHATKVPLNFKITVDGPTEFPTEQLIEISPLAADSTGEVEPGGSLTLTVSLKNPEDNLPEQIKIHVDDLDAIGGTRQTTTIFMTEIVWDL